MKIGSVEIPNKTVLAPLAGITNLPFRLMAKEAGCGLVCSEMVSSNGIVYNSGKTLDMLASTPEEKPLSLQIFGSKPDIMAEAAAIVEDSGADILDINFGCSVRKVLKTGSGSALMKTQDVAEKVLKAVRKTVSIPLTIKIRSGWDRAGNQALEVARMAEDCGVDAIAVHPRTATQGFGGTADWSIIRRVKEKSGIPVIGNGDIVTPEDAVRMLEETGCDAVMIGRAALSNPGIFTAVNALLDGRAIPGFELDGHFDMMERYLKASVRFSGETIASRMMRSRLGWFVKGLPSSSRFREEIKRIGSEAEALEIISGYRAFLKNRTGDAGFSEAAAR